MSWYFYFFYSRPRLQHCSGACISIICVAVCIKYRVSDSALYCLSDWRAGWQTGTFNTTSPTLCISIIFFLMHNGQLLYNFLSAYFVIFTVYLSTELQLQNCWIYRVNFLFFFKLWQYWIAYFSKGNVTLIDTFTLLFYNYWFIVLMCNKLMILRGFHITIRLASCTQHQPCILPCLFLSTF